MFIKKQLPLLIVFIAGVLMATQYFVPHQYSKALFDGYVQWAIVISVFGAIMGYFSFYRLHITRIVKKGTNWAFSLITVACTLVLPTVALIDGKGGKLFQDIFLYTTAAIDATIFSLLAFYISTAAYRAFRARSMQALMLLLAAVIVMLARVPLGEKIIPGIGSVSQWILNVPNMAAKRAILLGVGLGSLLMTLKLILGIERTYLGD